MLTVFLVVQTGINLLMLLGLVFLLRERRLTARLVLGREERLEALAAEFCSLGKSVVAGVRPKQAEPSRAETTEGGTDGGASHPPVSIGSSDPLETAVALLEQGFSVETVAARTAIPDGEVQVLRNLRRPLAPGAAPRRGRRSRATVRRQVLADV